MKPIHNQVFCVGCRKHKMLFESQSKANNFIRYNSEKILEESGKAPIRSYYCEFCGGYHVTSNPSSEAGERLDQRDQHRMENLSNYLHGIEEIKALSLSLSQRLEKIKSLLFIGEVSEAEGLLEICDLDLEEIASFPLKSNGKLTTQRSKVEKMKSFLASIKEALKLTEQELCVIISNQDHDNKDLSIALSNIDALQKIDSLIYENEELLQEKKTEGVASRIAKCRSLLGSIKRAGKKILKDRANQLDEQERQLEQIQSHLDSEEIIADPQTKKVPDKTQIFVDKKEYRNTLLSIIDRLETIQKACEEGDIDLCETELEICDYLLDDLHISDDNTELIKQRLAGWSELLKSQFE